MDPTVLLPMWLPGKPTAHNAKAAAEDYVVTWVEHYQTSDIFSVGGDRPTW